MQGVQSHSRNTPPGHYAAQVKGQSEPYLLFFAAVFFRAVFFEADFLAVFFGAVLFLAAFAISGFLALGTRCL